MMMITVFYKVNKFLFCYLDSFRMVNGLLKTAQGVPPGTATTLLPPQEVTMKLEAMKCLVAILKSMGDWMNKQLRIPDSHSSKKLDAAEDSSEAGSLSMANGNGDEPVEISDSPSESSTDASDVSTIEQRRAYKLELQVSTYGMFGTQADLFSLYLYAGSWLLPLKSNLKYVAGRYISF